MNDVNKKEDDPYYETYVKEFYKRYEYFVGFDILQINMREQDVNSRLNKLKNPINFEYTIHEIHKKLDTERQLHPCLSQDEFKLLSVHYYMNLIRVYAESLYRFNSIFFLPWHINSIGNMNLQKICDELHCTDERIKLKKCFFVDIRNALSHVDYHCEFDDNEKFKYLICNTGEDIIKLNLSKMVPIIEKIIKLINIQRRLITRYL